MSAHADERAGLRTSDGPCNRLLHPYDVPWTVPSRLMSQILHDQATVQAARRDRQRLCPRRRATRAGAEGGWHVPGRHSGAPSGSARVEPVGWRATQPRQQVEALAVLADAPSDDVGRADPGLVGLLVGELAAGSAARPRPGAGSGRPRRRARASSQPSSPAISSAAGRAAWMPRSKVSMEIRVRRVRTSSRCRAPSWVTA